MIDNLFVFDFDDTLAETVALIGVARKHNGKNDDMFREWLKSHDIYAMNEKTDDSGLRYHYLTSDDYASYQAAASADIIEDTIDTFDFSATSSVDPESTKAHEQVLQILKQVEPDPKNRVIIVTARATGKIDTPFGGANATNKEDIANFLQGVGVGVNKTQVYPVGSSNPVEKVNIVKKYIDSLSPATVYFYDDNDLNRDAIHQLCDEMRGSPNIITYKISDGVPSKDKEC